MSTYSRITKHPVTGVYEEALWIDDYFDHHIYGVKFSDDKVYPTEMVHAKEVETFWVKDVQEALQKLLPDINNEVMIEFLNHVQDAYKARWKRDPIDGEGAVAWKRSICDEPED